MAAGKILVKGLRPGVQRFRQLPRAMLESIERTADHVAVELLGRAQAVAPELTRHLVLSGAIDRSKQGEVITRVVKFTEIYALIMHEDFYQLGPLSRRKSGTQDGPVGRKYLERPYTNMRERVQREDFPQAVVRGVRSVLRVT